MDIITNTPAELRRETSHLVRANRRSGIIPLRDGKKAYTAGWPNTRAENQTDEQVEAIADAGNIGIVCGGEDGIDVLDIDPTLRPGESVETAVLRVKQDLGLYQVRTPEVRTRKGIHMYFAHDPANVLRNWVKPDGAEFDIRTTGGQVVGVGSVHQSGHLYHWVPGRRLGEVPLAALPVQFLTKLNAMTPRVEPTVAMPDTVAVETFEKLSPPLRVRLRAWAAAAMENECKKVATAKEGNRNSTLFNSACRLHELANTGLLDPDAVDENLREAAQRCGL